MASYGSDFVAKFGLTRKEVFAEFISYECAKERLDIDEESFQIGIFYNCYKFYDGLESYAGTYKDPNNLDDPPTGEDILAKKEYDSFVVEFEQIKKDKSIAVEKEKQKIVNEKLEEKRKAEDARRNAELDQYLSLKRKFGL